MSGWVFHIEPAWGTRQREDSALVRAYQANMSPMGAVTATEFAKEFEEPRRLREFERRVYRPNELPEDVLNAIKNARMDASHDHLNALLDEG